MNGHPSFDHQLSMPRGRPAMTGGLFHGPKPFVVQPRNGLLLSRSWSWRLRCSAQFESDGEHPLIPWKAASLSRASWTRSRSLDPPCCRPLSPCSLLLTSLRISALRDSEMNSLRRGSEMNSPVPSPWRRNSLARTLACLTSDLGCTKITDRCTGRLLGQ